MTTWGMHTPVTKHEDLCTRLRDAWATLRVEGPVRGLWASEEARPSWEVEVERQAWLRGVPRTPAA